MTQQQKQERDFFAQKIANKLTWGEADTQAMLDLLDPVWPGMTEAEANNHRRQRLTDFTREFALWESKRPKPTEKMKPMSDVEIEKLANML